MQGAICFALRRLRDWARNTSGATIVEFAFALPILLLMYLGGYQLSDAIACNRKVTIAARSVADLVSQYSTMAPSDVDTVLNASAQVMAPYSIAPAGVRVSEIYVDKNGQSNIVWSRALHESARSAGTSFTVPSQIATKDTYLIYSEVNYAYQPITTYGLSGTLGLHDAIFMNPRISNSVICNGC